MSIDRGEAGFPTLDVMRAPQALEALDEVVRLYMGGMRKMQRKILTIRESSFATQETNAEHSWSVGMAIRTMWENRQDLGIDFGPDFDIELAKDAALVHDIGEVRSRSGDVDAVSTDRALLDAKEGDEIEGFEQIGRENNYLGWVVRAGIDYIPKNSPEYRFASDIDKHVGTRVICLYDRWRWWGTVGEAVTRERHSAVIRGKMFTNFGHVLFDEIELDLDKRELEHRDGSPGLFPPPENILPRDVREAFVRRVMKMV